MKYLYLTFVTLLLSITSFAVAPITGTTSVCIGSTTLLSDATPGGIWTSSAYGVANLTSSTSGLVTGVSAGTATITYDVSGVYSTITVTVLATPPAIGGAPSVCIGTSTTLTDPASGGVWSCAASSIAIVGTTTGVVTGATVGSATVTYSLPTGCYATKVINVVSTPSPITGTPTLCTGSTTSLSCSTGGGMWTSSITSIAPVGSSSGIVTGISPGTATISYSSGSGCTDTINVTVISAPAAITGGTSICQGSTSTLSDATPGGTWSSSAYGIANLTSSTSGVVTGVAAGTATITYSIGTGCNATVMVSVIPVPPGIGGILGVCTGSTTLLTDATSGGTWSSINTSVATINPATGIASGLTIGTTVISYTIPSGCASVKTLSVVSSPSAIFGPTNVCTGFTVSLSDVITGGTWSSGASAVATVGLTTGTVSGVSTGTAVITYSIGTGCSVYQTETVIATPGAITGTTSVCVGSTTTLSDAGGGTWTSSAYSIANLTSSTSGLVTGIAGGTATITYSLGSGCIATTAVTVYPAPIISIASPTLCGSSDTLIASGGTTYSWAPVSGLSCTSCATTIANPTSNTTYTVTSTSALGCPGSATISLIGNRIFGHITFSSYAPDTVDMKVWLIQYDPTDSSIKSVDSTVTCTMDSIGYYQFDNKPAGSYLVKAKMLFPKPVGTSGYIPTYSLSTPSWSSATAATHVISSDSLHVTMIYGSVPAGPGFISGNVYFGAGKGTGDAPAVGMLIYLENKATKVLTYTYTDATGRYSFNSLAYGNYIIYPEEYIYNTTPSSLITLDAANPGSTGRDFKQYTTSKRIVPIYPTGLSQLSAGNNIAIFPNPASGTLNCQWKEQKPGNVKIVITDMLGREVLCSLLSINTVSGKDALDVHVLRDGLYQISIISDNINYTNRLLIQK